MCSMQIPREAALKSQNIDNAREFDWGKTSRDYARYRPGYPESFYDTLEALGIGRRGQRILDLGTGTGVLARAFAKRGAIVTGIDVSDYQILQARRLADDEGLQVRFQVCAAEGMDVPDESLDVISAGQSWLYFDIPVVIPKVLRALDEDGCLVLTHLVWLPRQDPIARASEELVLKYNPDWSGVDFPGHRPHPPRWSLEHFDVSTFHIINRPIEFTRESWRGRLRACRGIGASLSDDLVEQFDREHDRLLRDITGETFTVLHQMSVHVFVRKGQIASE
jgi:SAM-dependent methyltransferase